MASKDDELEQKRQEKAIKWATTHGAPIRLLSGWNPDDGTWEDKSPVAEAIADIRKGSHVGVAGRRRNMDSLVDLQFKGSEYDNDSEDRALIPVERRVFVDLYRAIVAAEAEAEIELSNAVYDKALDDGKLGMDFLGRRWPNRWKEQQIATVADEDDMRERAISKIIEDPVAAAKLAEIADMLEDDIEAQERAAAEDG